MRSNFAFTRREMITASGYAAAAAVLPKWFLEQTLDAAQVAEPKSANDKPGVLLIGCGGRGQADADEASRFCKIVAVCDVDDRHAQGAARKYAGAKPHHDFREALQQKDV